MKKRIYDFLFCIYFWLPKGIQYIVSKNFYNVKVGKGVKFFGYSTFSKNVSIGDYTYICEQCHLSNVSIGKYCCIAKRVSIVDGQHPYNSFSNYDFFNQIGSPLKNKPLIISDNISPEFKKTYIGNDVWIGEDVTIKGGVKIGDGAVIGSKSMVTKDVPEFSIVVGNPAKVIKYRFETSKQQYIKNIEWWNMSIDQLYKNFKNISNFGENV